MLGASLALAWALLLACPFVVLARRHPSAQRAHALSGGAGNHGERRASPVSGRLPWPAPSALRNRVRELPGSRVVLAPFTRRASIRRAAAVAAEVPVVVDLLAVAVGAGCTPYLAVEHAAKWSPPSVADALHAVVRACAFGASFADAWRDVARQLPQLESLADALTIGERTGAPVGPALTRLAAEERASARRRIEAHARRVPVRLLFPLVFLVLPAFVVLTVVPGLAAGLQRL
ncbi:MAG: type II secretion system F family protein [Acidimicrobiia bacterium]